MSADTARQICCDAEVTAVVMGADGAVLDARPLSDKPTRAQRCGVIGRDGRCVGCGAPGSLTRSGAGAQAGLRGGAKRPFRPAAKSPPSRGPAVTSHHHMLHHCGWIVVTDEAGRDHAGPPEKFTGPGWRHLN